MTVLPGQELASGRFIGGALFLLEAEALGAELPPSGSRTRWMPIPANQVLFLNPGWVSRTGFS